MVFSSAMFLSLFLPCVLGFYFLAAERFRNIVLLFASLFFYAWGEPKAVFLMMVLIALSYGIAILMDRNNGNIRKLYLIIGICSNLAGLLYYKYWMFLLENINIFSSVLHFKPFNIPTIALPIGISFYVFQIMSYLIDVYKKEVPAQKSFVNLATYVSLFPQLVAGPIVRYQTIMEDIENRNTNFDNVYIGLRRFVIGLAKKVLIADQMAFVADKVFNSELSTIPCLFAWVGAIAYTLQIFYDFSGYSDMAIGLGRVFNFRFLENFNYPYCSQSIKEFWRRWHISLSSWFRDYLYIPLGGNRKGKLRTFINMYIVFGLCGLWHGATWNFVIWGLYHGTGLVLEKLALDKIINKLQDLKFKNICYGKLILNLYVILFVVIGWVIFRAETLPQAAQFLRIMFTGNSGVDFNSFYTALDFLTYSNLWIAIIGIICSYPIFSGKYLKFKYSNVETILIIFLFIITYVFAMTSTFSPFIYFRF